MSRYAGDVGNNATSNDRAGAYGAETPLPTYDEVVASENPSNVHLGFKTDVLLPARSSDQGHRSSAEAAGAPADRESEDTSRRPTSCKPNRTGTILVLLGMILIPMCGMIIILQVKVCATKQSQLQQTIDKINASYSECSIDLASVQENLDSNENLIRDLNYQVEQLNIQKRQLGRMLSRVKNSIN